MAYQHLFGSSANSIMGAGYCTLAYTPEFYDYLSDSEISNYNVYPFNELGKHPIKFYHFYDEYRGVFVQSAISFEHDYAGRDSYIANSMVLTEEETKRILTEKIIPLQRNVFMNGLSDDFERPSSETLPAIDYPMEGISKEHIFDVIKSFFTTMDELNKFVYAILTMTNKNHSIFVSLPCEAAEMSIRAVEFMNILIPALPVEYKKKIGFVTYADTVSVYKDFNIYFVTVPELKHQYIPDGYVFDFASPERTIVGIDEEDLSKYKGLIDEISFGVCGQDKNYLSIYNAFLAMQDEYNRYQLETLNEIHHMGKAINGDNELFSDDFALVLSSVFKYLDDGMVYKILDKSFLDIARNIGEDEKYNVPITIYRVMESNFNRLSGKIKKLTVDRWFPILILSYDKEKYDILKQIFNSENEYSDFYMQLLTYTISYAYAFMTQGKGYYLEALGVINVFINFQLEKYNDFRSICAVMRIVYNMLESPDGLKNIELLKLSSTSFDRFLFFRDEVYNKTFRGMLDNLAASADIPALTLMMDILYTETAQLTTVERDKLADYIFKDCIIDRVSSQINYDTLMGAISSPERMESFGKLIYRINQVSPNEFAENRLATLYSDFTAIYEKCIQASNGEIAIVVELKKYTESDQNKLNIWALEVYRKIKRKPVFLFLAFTKYTADKDIFAAASLNDIMSSSESGLMGTVPMGAPADSTPKLDYNAIISEAVKDADATDTAKKLNTILELAIKYNLSVFDAKEAILNYIQENMLNDSALDKKTIKENDRLLNEGENIRNLLHGKRGGFGLPFRKNK